jgi:uncharacterized protein (DUF736 family)
MIIGKFRQQDDAAYAGILYGIGLACPYVTFSPIRAKVGNGPDFVVLGTPPEDSGDFELGAAWRKTSKKGKAYLSVRLDGPTLIAPINCALTSQPDGSHALVWNRKEAQPAEAEAAG